jgi:hypothetical protein
MRIDLQLQQQLLQRAEERLRQAQILTRTHHTRQGTQ